MFRSIESPPFFMTYYLPLALLVSVVFFFLSYQAYKRNDPRVIFGGGLILLLFLRLMSALYPGIWNSDEAEWVSLAYSLPKCDIPYQCFDAHSTGYLNILVLKLFYYLGIEYSYASVRVFGLLCFTIPSVILFYKILRRIYSTEIVILGMIFLFHYFLFGAHSFDLFAYNSEYVIMFFTTAVYYCYILYTREKKLLPLVIAAVCMGIMPLSKLQSLPIVAGFTVLFFIHFLKNKKISHLLLFCGIGILPVLITVLCFWQLGVLDKFWLMYVETNQYLVKHYSTIGLIGRIKAFVYLQRWIMPYYIIVFILLLIAYSQKKLSWRIIKEIDFGQVFVLAGAYVSIGITGTGAEHYTTLIIIPLFLVIANIISALDIEMYLAQPKRLRAFSLLLLFTGMMFLLLPEFKTWKDRFYHYKRPVRTNLVDYVQKITPPGEPLCVFGWLDAIEIQVSCKRPLATRTAHNYYLLADKDTALMRYYQEQYISDLEVSKPRLVIDPAHELDSAIVLPVKQYVLKNYELDTILDASRVYKRINQ